MDDDWAERLADDLDGSFEAFVRAHQHQVFTLARRLTAGREDAEDVAQEALVRAYRALSTYPPERIRTMRLRPWLMQIALNAQRNRVRSLRPQTTLEHEPVAPPHEQPDAIAGDRSATAEMARLLSCLPDETRTAVVLRHVVGLPYNEVAEALGRPVGTVKAQVHRGLRRLRSTIEEEEDQP